jgi:hypothetical protein
MVINNKSTKPYGTVTTACAMATPISILHRPYPALASATA